MYDDSSALLHNTALPPANDLHAFRLDRMFTTQKGSDGGATVPDANSQDQCMMVKILQKQRDELRLHYSHALEQVRHLQLCLQSTNSRLSRVNMSERWLQLHSRKLSNEIWNLESRLIVGSTFQEYKDLQRKMRIRYAAPDMEWDELVGVVKRSRSMMTQFG